MKKYAIISRHDFLKIMGIAASAVVLKACTPSTKRASETAIPTETKPPPLPTLEPTQKINPTILPEMVMVEAGDFEMGSTDGYANEQPVHTVTITKPFYISKYEVTFEEYDIFCEKSLRYNKPDDRGNGRGKRPVIGVEWQDAIEYCNWLSEEEGLSPCYSGKGKVTKCDFSANGYRLPTEAEWEYAARGGQKSQGYIFAGNNNPDDVAWYGDNSGGAAHSVGQKEPNEIGLYDMSGNIYEWCWDWYVKDYYHESPAVDPQGPPLPQVESPWDLVRVRRSGSWPENSDSIRTTTRSFDLPSYPGDNGFRLVRMG
ncbi:MAG: formylglycine-generating enzyme family protein [Anaerolineales bacterium]|nr:formylglycine-generating enzyme family protein [Anaerolineales bacterium]